MQHFNISCGGETGGGGSDKCRGVFRKIGEIGGGEDPRSGWGNKVFFREV